MKPLEFVITKGEYYQQYETYEYIFTFFYEDGSKKEMKTLDYVLTNFGLELNKHYSIADIYGYQVKDDREGL